MGLEWFVSYCQIYHLRRIVSAGSYRWIVSYWLGWIVLYLMVSAGSGNINFYVLAGYCLYGIDGLDGALVGQGWDGGGMDIHYYPPERERHHGHRNRSADVGS